MSYSFLHFFTEGDSIERCVSVNIEESELHLCVYFYMLTYFCCQC